MGFDPAAEGFETLKSKYSQVQFCTLEEGRDTKGSGMACCSFCRVIIQATVPYHYFFRPAFRGDFGEGGVLVFAFIRYDDSFRAPILPCGLRTWAATSQ